MPDLRPVLLLLIAVLALPLAPAPPMQMDHAGAMPEMTVVAPAMPDDCADSPACPRMICVSLAAILPGCAMADPPKASLRVAEMERQGVGLSPHPEPRPPPAILG